MMRSKGAYIVKIKYISLCVEWISRPKKGCDVLLLAVPPPTNTLQPPGEGAFPTGIFAGTKITPDALVQTLKLEEPPRLFTSPTPVQKGRTCSEMDSITL